MNIQYVVLIYKDVSRETSLFLFYISYSCLQDLVEELFYNNNIREKIIIMFHVKHYKIRRKIRLYVVVKPCIY